MKIITYANNYNNHIFHILQNKLGVEPLDTLGGNFQLYHKIIAVDKYIANLNDSEVIVFLDAFDVLPVNGVNIERLDYAISKYMDLEKITFNSEVNCAPDPSLSKYFSNIPGEWKYLNSGMYVGRVGQLKPLLSEIINTYLKKLPSDVQPLHDVMGDFNDQLVFIKQYIKNSQTIALDYNCIVLQTLFCGYVHCPPYHKLKIDYVNKTIFNTITRTYPLLVHGNGKVILDSIMPIV